MSNNFCEETTMGENEQKEEEQTLLSLRFLFKEEDDSEDETEFLQGLVEVEKIIGYKFENTSLLSEALTDSSYHSLSYDRLEYLGDSVLNLMIARENFSKNLDLKPAKITRRFRAANANNVKLARVAINRGLHKYVRHKQPLLNGQIQEFITAMEKEPVQPNGLIDSPKILADIVESLIGAIFLDTNSSLDCTWKIVKPLITPIIIPEKVVSA